jgi:hypothetical protein
VSFIYRYEKEPARRDRSTTLRNVGGVIAEFACGRDARLFASIKRENGEVVTITPGINLLYAVRSVRAVAL